MNTTGFITDVSYHYIGLRVLAGLPADAERSQQVEAIARNVLKFATDRALRMMSKEPRTTFSSVSEKICGELKAFQFVSAERGRPYQLTADGCNALALLEGRQYVELRRLMTRVHLQTYDNLRAVVKTHVDGDPVWSPIVAISRLGQPDYLQRLLEPTFGADAAAVVKSVESDLPQSPKRIEDVLRAKVLRQVMPAQKMNVALFRNVCDRLVSLRLLNKARIVKKYGEFEKTYSPCTVAKATQPWYAPLQVPLADGATYQIYLCEPDMANHDHQDVLLAAVDQAFAALPTVGGYYHIPDVRDWVCEHLLIPEAAFDDGINRLLDRQPAPLSVGLQYDQIAGHRPLVRTRQATQLHNLIRRI